MSQRSDSWPSLTAWRFPSDWPALSRDQVHVWRGWLDPTDPIADRLTEALSTDERQRAARYRSQRDARRFKVARGLLRCILGRYAGMAPGQVRFCYAFHGKPYLAPEQSTALSFNVSHADGLGLFAVALDRRVGVDVERLREIPEMAQIAAQHFSAVEYAQWLSTPELERMAAFYRCWTLKEAYVKALGEGLTRSLAEFSVSLAPDAPDRLLEVQHLAEAGEWVLQSFCPGVGFAAALAIEGRAAISYLDASPNICLDEIG